MTAKRSLKRLVRSRMRTTGETYTTALLALRGPDSQLTNQQGDPTMAAPNPEPTGTIGEAEGIAVPILPARDIPETLAFFERLAFATVTYEGGGYAFVRRGGIELQYAHHPDVDPFSTAGIAFIRVRDAAGLYEEFRGADLWEPSLPGPELGEEMRRRWASGESIARLVHPEHKPWGLLEFALFDPCNNLLRIGQPLNG